MIWTPHFWNRSVYLWQNEESVLSSIRLLTLLCVYYLCFNDSFVNADNVLNICVFIIHIRQKYVPRLGWALWNQSFEFKFDDTRKAKLRQPTGQRLSNIRKQQTKISIGPILFLYYEESLVSSNLNSKQLRFHGAHPNIQSNVEVTVKKL